MDDERRQRDGSPEITAALLMSVFKQIKSFVYVSVLAGCIWIAIAIVSSAFRTDQPRFKFSRNRPWATSTDYIFRSNEMLTCTNDLIRLKNTHQ